MLDRSGEGNLTGIEGARFSATVTFPLIIIRGRQAGVRGPFARSITVLVGRGHRAVSAAVSNNDYFINGSTT